MLELNNITKNYKTGDAVTPVLKGVSFTLRDSEFVSVLGPSGCGKTTMLNIIGGLDKYTSGDLIINGKSTKMYKDRDWDNYRSRTIGFVFQSYNLIPHQTVLKNVEFALSISNYPRAERKRLAIEALEKVGLKDHLRKKPNQLSGGQCQRVSIARALVTDPDIILADEPTGALDTETSLQIMEILKKISEDRLVLMVTHNPELAQKYSTRIVNMLDGVITSDTNPVNDGEKAALYEKARAREVSVPAPEKKKTVKKSSMSLFSAIKLSLSNLLTKKGRTFITALACSIGIIGIAVILSVSNGMQAYISEVQRDSAATNFILISGSPTSFNLSADKDKSRTEYPSGTTGVYPYVRETAVSHTEQQLSEDYVNYLETNLRGDNDLVLGISYARNTALNVVAQTDGEYFAAGTADWNEILDNREYLTSQYDTLAGKGLPTTFDEIVLVVDKYNRIPTALLDAIGIPYTDKLDEISYSEFIGKQFRLALNDDFYTPVQNGDFLKYNKITSDSSKLQEVYETAGITLTVVSVIREKKTAASSWIPAGIGYTQALTEYVLEHNANGDIVEYQKAHEDYDVLTGEFFVREKGASLKNNLIMLGADSTPASISIYPKDLDSKDKIVAVLDRWNNSEIYKLYGNEKDEDGKYLADKYIVEYTDVSKLLSSMLNNMINIITKTLIAFSVVSLVVSSIMIAIITYASVIERIKEIGIIRSLGGRKRDVSRVFIAEACIIGGVAAIIALVFTLLINLVINLILGAAVGITSIASLSVGTAFGMIVLAVGLNLIASLIPARIAARKDPVVALRTE